MIGGLKPYSVQDVAVQYSNQAESCFGRGLSTATFSFSTRRSSAPGPSSRPLILAVTGGTVTLAIVEPLDDGGFFKGITGYLMEGKPISASQPEAPYRVVYDGTNDKTKLVQLSGLTANTGYHFRSRAKSFIQYADMGLHWPPSAAGAARQREGRT